MSCSLGVPIGRLHLGEGRSLTGRVWTSLDWRSWGQELRVKTGRRVEVADVVGLRARPRSHRERIWAGGGEEGRRDGEGGRGGRARLSGLIWKTRND